MASILCIRCISFQSLACINLHPLVTIPPEVHRALAMEAAEQGVSLNRLASAKLAG